MIEFRYTHFDERLRKLIESFKDLLALFNHLVLMMSGDVERALKYMKYLQELGYIDKDIDLDKLKDQLKKAGIISQTPRGKLVLTNKGERYLRRSALEEIFTSLKKSEFGQHRTPFSGEGGERLPETRQFQWGDDLGLLDLGRSVQNALTRSVDLNLIEQDLEVSETEHHTSCATVLLIDISHSMVIYGEDRITPAKKVALALAELIREKYPKDSLNIVVFGDDALEIKLHELAYIGAGPFHTNTKAALATARKILMRKKHPNKQIFMITDGKPSAIYDDCGIYVNPIGLDPKIVAQTLEEASICRRFKIIITTFMLTDEPVLVEFVNKLTKINHGRAYFANCSDISRSVFVDYIRNRRKKLG